MRAVAVMLGLACAVSAWAQNIIANGDIETGGRQSPLGWQNHIAEGDYEFLISDQAHSGKRCLAIRAREGVTEGWARWYTTDLYLLEGAVYRLRAWVRTEGGGIAQLWVPSDDRGFSQGLSDLPEWTLFERDFTVSRTGRHGLYLQNRGGGTVYYDDISVELAQAPPPATVWQVPTDGPPISGIVIPDGALAHHGYLAQELQRVFQAMTGQIPPVLAASAAPSGTFGRYVWVGVVPPGRNYSPQLREAGEEGIVLDIGPEAVVCLGNSPRGVYYAVQELFHVLGCRWCWPGPLGEVIPKVEKLSLPPTLIVHRPSFELRGGHIIQAFHTPPDWTVKHCNEEEWIDWAARNRMNRLKASYATTWDYGAIRGGSRDEVAGHSLYHILPPEKWFASHPEYYPLVQGRRTHLHSSGRAAEICVSNPDLPHIFAEAICDFFASHPQALRYCINAEDEPDYWCECEACKALDPVPQDWSKNGLECLHLTDRWLTFINRVAELVEEQYPDRWIATFAYGSTRELPYRVLPRRNVMIELTWWDQCFRHGMRDRSCPTNAKGMERFQGWSRLAPVALYRYLDYHHMESPGPFFHAEADILRTAHAGGCRWLSDEWDTTFTASPLLLNLRARLEWDVNTDVDAYISDFCRRVYGKAGPEVERYWRRLERSVRDAASAHVSFNDMTRFTPAVLRYGHACLDRAEALADDDAVRGRLARLRYSLLFAELDQVTAAAEKDPSLYVRQAELQDRIWALVDQHKIEPVVGYYDRLGRDYRPPLSVMTGDLLVTLPLVWKFRTDPEDAGEAAGWASAVPDGNWTDIRTDASWVDQGHNYHGVAWYTTELQTPAVPAGRKAWLLFGAVDGNCWVWLDGQRVGAQTQDVGLMWDKPFALEVTPLLKPGRTQRLTVKVKKDNWAAGIWKPVELRLER